MLEFCEFFLVCCSRNIDKIRSTMSSRLFINAEPSAVTLPSRLSCSKSALILSISSLTEVLFNVPIFVAINGSITYLIMMPTAILLNYFDPPLLTQLIRNSWIRGRVVTISPQIGRNRCSWISWDAIRGEASVEKNVFQRFRP